MIEVNPASLAGDVLFPLFGVAKHGLAAVVVEGFKAHRLHFAFVFNAELFFGFKLGGQTVAVPTEHAADLLATHRLVARDDVFDITGQQVAIVRQAISEGRAVVEDVFVVAFTILNGGIKSAIFGPEVQHCLFHLGEAL